MLQNFKATVLPNLFLSTAASYVWFLHLTFSHYLDPIAVGAGTVGKQDALYAAVYMFIVALIINTTVFLVITALASKRGRSVGSSAFRNVLLIVSVGIAVTQILPTLLGLIWYWNELPSSKSFYDYQQNVSALLYYGSLLINIGLGWLALVLSKGRNTTAKKRSA